MVVLRTLHRLKEVEGCGAVRVSHSGGRNPPYQPLLPSQAFGVSRPLRAVVSSVRSPPPDLNCH